MKLIIELIEPIYVILLWTAIIASILFAIAAVMLAPYLMFFITRKAICLFGYGAYMIIVYFTYKILK